MLKFSRLVPKDPRHFDQCGWYKVYLKIQRNEGSELLSEFLLSLVTGAKYIDLLATHDSKIKIGPNSISGIKVYPKIIND